MNLNLKKVSVIGSAILVMGSLGYAFSTTPNLDGKAVHHARSAELASNAALPVAAPAVAPTAGVAPAAGVAEAKLALVPPPAELPRAGAKAAPAKAAVAGEKAAAKKAVKAQSAMAVAKKPKNLFSYVRMLNYSPHPAEEEFLREKPLTFNGKQYHITVAYRENWNVVNDDEGYLKKLGFDISVFENGNKVRSLKLPEVSINPNQIKKGQVLGLAEVAPYKFKVAVDSFTVRDGGITDLTFKFVMDS